MERNVNLVIKIQENVNTVIHITKCYLMNYLSINVKFAIKKYFQMKHVLKDISKIMKIIKTNLVNFVINFIKDIKINVHK